MKQKGSIITKTIGALQKRLAENNQVIQIQSAQGYLYKATCTFHPPASEEELHEFEKKTGFMLPVDYKEFLKITNGCYLFDDIQYGGETHLYSLEEILAYNNAYDPHEGCFDIACTFQDNIVINSQMARQNKQNYIFWKGHIDQFSEAIPLKMNFEIWFDRFVVTQGSKFWNWPFYTADNYYRLC